MRGKNILETATAYQSSKKSKIQLGNDAVHPKTLESSTDAILEMDAKPKYNGQRIEKGFMGSNKILIRH